MCYVKSYCVYNRMLYMYLYTSMCFLSASFVVVVCLFVVVRMKMKLINKTSLKRLIISGSKSLEDQRSLSVFMIKGCGLY